MERVLLVKHRLDNVFVCGPGDKSFRTSQINRRSDDNLGELHAARPADQQREKLEDGARHGEGERRHTKVQQSSLDARNAPPRVLQFKNYTVKLHGNRTVTLERRVLRRRKNAARK